MNNFANQLKYWRKARGLSQLALAASAGSTPRYISFMENGKSRPGEQMVRRLADALEMPMRERNDLLEAAGHRRENSALALSEPQMRPYCQTVKHVLKVHDPFPAFVVNRWWDIVDLNAGAERFFRLLEPDTMPRNMIEWLFDPAGVARTRFDAWTAVAYAFLRRVRREAMNAPLDARLARLLAVAEKELASADVPASSGPGNDLVVCPTVRFGDAEVSLVGMTSRFGAPLDVTLDELTVECLYPRDEQSEQFLRSLEGRPVLRLASASG